MMLIQTITIDTMEVGLLDRIFSKRSEAVSSPTPKGASVYISTPPEFTGKVFAADKRFVDTDNPTNDDRAVMIDGSEGDRFVSFEVDDLSSVILTTDSSSVSASIIVKTWG